MHSLLIPLQPTHKEEKNTFWWCSSYRNKKCDIDSFKVQILSCFIHFMQMSLYRRYNREMLRMVGLNNIVVDDKTKWVLVLILKQTEHAN